MPDDINDHELALEICLTSLVFKDLEVDINKENEETSEDVNEEEENFSHEIIHPQKMLLKMSHWHT